ncbi:MAG: hypothetical protein DDT31_01333 [Syntrophomonadaceae bacterium]|nr:hypothetical protein [Bacillota bacterium]
MTFGEMVADLGGHLGYTIGVNSHLTLTEAERLINQGLLDFSVRTGILTSRAPISSVANQAEYSLAGLPNFLRVVLNGVLFENRKILKGKSTVWLDRNKSRVEPGDWRRDGAGIPEVYYTLQVDGVNTIGFYPRTGMTATNNIVISFVRRANRLLVPSDRMESSISHYWELPIQYAYSKAKRREGEVAIAKSVMNDYFMGCAVARAEKRQEPDRDFGIYLREL